MAAVPKTALTFDSLVLRVAERLGIAEYRSDGTAMLPVTNLFSLSKACEMVQRGVGMLFDASPNEGWHFTRRSIEVLFYPDGDGDDNIDTDPARYMLPVDFGGELKGDIRYAADSNHGTQIEWTDARVIKNLRQDYIDSGYPMLAAILPYQPTSTAGTGRRWELIVSPQPSVEDTVTFDYVLHFDGVLLYGGAADSASSTNIVDATFATTHNADDYFNNWYVEIVDGTGRGSYALVTDYTASTGTFTVADWLAPDGTAGGTDPGSSSKFVVKPAHPYYHPIGFAFDSVLDVACLAATEIYGRAEMTDDHFTSMFYNRKVPEAHRINRRQIPRRVGKMTRGRVGLPVRNWSNVTTEHDV
jgi:hypothetical protein